MSNARPFADLTVEKLTEDLRELGYIADRGLATSILISLKLGKPLLLEGEVGVGKTELAKTLAIMFQRELIRLQCYEGIDTNHALYEWDYARQMLHIRSLTAAELTDNADEQLFSPKFLLERERFQFHGLRLENRSRCRDSGASMHHEVHGCG